MKGSKEQMTSEAILIVGYKIDAQAYNDIEILQQKIEDYIKSKLNDKQQHSFKYRDYDNFNTDNKPVLFFVNRVYDSIDMHDYGIYLAYNYLDLGTYGNVIKSEKLIKLAETKSQTVDDNINDILEKLNLKIMGNFNIFSDCYDSDRTFDIYDLSEFIHC